MMDVYLFYVLFIFHIYVPVRFILAAADASPLLDESPDWTNVEKAHKVTLMQNTASPLWVSQLEKFPKTNVKTQTV